MSLGKDLASIRERQNLTLEEVQNAIKIPLLTLKSIENNSIFDDNAENKAYRRSFVRSYAKLLKLDDAHVVNALDAMEAGTYHSGLLTGSSQASDSEDDYEPIDPFREEAVPQPKQAPAPAPSPAEQNPTPTINSVNWADMGRRFNTVSKNSKSWVVLVSILLIVLLGGGMYVFSDQIISFFDAESTPSQQLVFESNGSNQPPSTADSITETPVEAEVDETAQGLNTVPPSAESITLGETLTVTVYAAYGQLEPIRITSDLNWRTNPFWMEHGEAYNFDFKDTLLVRGQYSRLVLLFNGHPIENPRQNHFSREYNSIMITRNALNQPKYLAPAPEEFPLPVGAPDSIVYRIQL